LWLKAEGSPWVAEVLGTLDGYTHSAALGICALSDAAAPDTSIKVTIVGSCFSAEDSVATLWVRTYPGTSTAHNLNHLIVNQDALDLDLRIGTGIVSEAVENRSCVTGWGLEQVGIDRFSSPFAPHAFLLIEGPAAAVPEPRADGAGIKLSAAPIPSSSGVRVSYSLPHGGEVSLTVHDVLGRCVATLKDGLVGAGGHSHFWSGVSPQGRPEAPGVYFLRLKVGGFSTTEKVVLLR
jgi:hypothetical protein